VSEFFLEGEWGDSLLPSGAAEPPAAAAAFPIFPFKEKNIKTESTNATKKRTGQPSS
jgi:hypothetical protein